MKIVFFGLGSIGQRHLQNIIKLYPNTKLYCYKKRNDYFEIKNGKINNKVNIIKKYKIKELKRISDLEKYKIDYAFICNPSSMHLKYALIAANYGINLFIEKPLSNSNKNIEKLKKIIKIKKINCIMGYNLRFNKSFQYIKKTITQKKLGNIYKADFFNGEYLPDYHKYEDYKQTYAAKKKLGGGVLLTQIHEIDLILNLFGSPKKIYCHIDKLSNLKIDVEDSVDAIMVMKKMIVNLHLDYITKPSVRFLKIFGEKKNLFWNYYKNKITIYDKIKNKEKILILGKFDRNQMFNDQIKNIFRKKKIKNTPFIQAGIDSLKTVLQIKKKSKF